MVFHYASFTPFVFLKKQPKAYTAMKTKLIISAILLSSLSNFIFSQSLEQENKNKWQIGITLNTVEPGYDFALSQKLLSYSHRTDNSYCVGLNASYRVKQNCYVRVSTKITNNKVKEYKDDSETNNTSNSGYEIDIVNSEQTVITLAPGVLWDFEYKKIKLYGGGQVVYKKYNPIVSSFTAQAFDSQNLIIGYTINHQTEQGGFALGCGPVGGFSINLWKNICLGGEFSSAYSYYKLGGEVASTRTNVLLGTTDKTITNQQTFRVSGFSNVLSSIIISINF